MRFADQRNVTHAGAVHKARAVEALLTIHDPDAENGYDRDGEQLTGVQGTVIYSPAANHGAGMIQFQDADGEARVMDLPPGMTSDAVAGLLHGMAVFLGNLT